MSFQRSAGDKWLRRFFDLPLHDWWVQGNSAEHSISRGNCPEFPLSRLSLSMALMTKPVSWQFLSRALRLAVTLYSHLSGRCGNVYVASISPNGQLSLVLCR